MLDKNFTKENVEEIMALSPLQKGMLFHYLLDRSSSQYLEQLSLRLQGELEPVMLHQAWQLVAANNEMLRTVFRWDKLENPIQVVLRHKDIPLTLHDFTAYDAWQASELVQERKLQDCAEPLDLATAPFRLNLCKLSATEWELVITNHHILYDGWSTGVLLKEFLQTYEQLRAGKSVLPTVKTSYREYIKFLTSQKVQEQRAYWREYLKGVESETFLPFAEQAAESGLANARYDFTLTGSLQQAVSDYAAKQQVTVAAIVSTAWGILLQKYNCRRDVLFGSTFSGRTVGLTGIEEMVGLFINTLPVRVKGRKDVLVRDLVREVTKDLQVHESFVTTALTEIPAYAELPAGEGLFNSLVVIENYPLDRLLSEKGSTSLQLQSYASFEYTNYPLTLIVTGLEQLNFSLNYQQGLFAPTTIGRLAGHLTNILASMLADEGQELAGIEMLSEVERGQILFEFNSAEETNFLPQTLVELMARKFRAVSSAETALVLDDMTMTYGEVWRRSNQLAHLLREKGVLPGASVGIMLNRSFEMVIGILGILKAGALYLPLDPKLPEERVRFMLSDSGAKIVLTDSAAKVQQFDGEFIDLTALGTYVASEHDLPLVNKPTDLAYIIYTSGSTGTPKGVMIEQGSVVNLLQNVESLYPLTSVGAYILKTTFTFDVSVAELFGWWMGGGKLVILPPGAEKDPEILLQTVAAHAVTHLNFVPSMLGVFLGYLSATDSRRITSLQYIFVAGEAIANEMVKEFYRLVQDVRLINLYGPTETTVYATHYSLDQLREQIFVPIGKPLTNYQVVIVDQDNQLEPIGVPGELCIAGAGLARGYINNPELTEQKFIDNPWFAGQRMYKTGDLVSWQADGNIQFIRRMDDQVKLRGYRIELGEIENHLLKHPMVQQAAVLLQTDPSGDQVLSAYVVTNGQVEATDLREHLRHTLPEYMLPAHFVQLAELPITASGKLDRRKLPELGERLGKAREFLAPSTELEEKLVGLWRRVLAVDQIGVQDNFFELGGHSLKATRLASLLQKELAVDVPLKVIFQHPTIYELGQYIEQATCKPYAPIPLQPEEATYPLASAQKRLYVVQQLDKISISYNMPGAVKLTGEVSYQAIEQALLQLIQRHDALRTSFLLVDGEPRQRVEQAVEFHCQKLVAADADLSEAFAEFVQPFDLSVAPLLRVGVVPVEDGHVLFFDMHHIISDGRSLEIIVDEFAKVILGQQLSTLPIQYKDYVSWHNEFLQGITVKDQEKYWLGVYADTVPVLNLPVDRLRPREFSQVGKTVFSEIAESTTARLHELGHQTGTTPFMNLLSVFYILLAKYASQPDIVVGTPVLGRQHPDLDNLVGMFVNTVALRAQPEMNKRFAHFLQDIKSATLHGYENQDYPFEQLVDKLDLPRDLGKNPLFDVLFAYEENVDQGMGPGEVTITPLEVGLRLAKFDLTLTARERNGRITLEFAYRPELLTVQTVQRMARHYGQILHTVLANPEVCIKDIDLILPEERAEILTVFNAPQRAEVEQRTIVDVFEEKVMQNPEQLAVISIDRQWTYAQLNRQANKLARSLRVCGVERGHIVAIMVQDKLAMILGQLAILKLGAVFLPLSAEYPRVRNEFILADSQAKLLLTAGATSLEFDSPIQRFDLSVEKWLELNEDAEATNTDATDLDTLINPHDLAYVIYTSGTSGEPKGVLVEHAGLVNLQRVFLEVLEVTAADRVAQFASFTFDASVWEIYMAFFTGATLNLVEKAIINNYQLFTEYLMANQITIVTLPPAYLANLQPEKLTCLRVVITGGSATNASLVTRWQNCCRYFNAYGPTEGTICSTIWEAGPDFAGYTTVPIGQPLPDTQVYIVDAHLQGGELRLLPPGIPGELCIAGRGVARGYMQRPALTGDKFLPDPFALQGRLYRTGDLARWLADGQIEFLGRIDQQVKIRGFRIELGEIESQLQQHELVKEVVVIDKADPTGEQVLVAYIVALKEVPASVWREYLATVLPEYMIPTYFISIEKLPVTLNGKVDYRALPDPVLQQGGEYQAATNLTEQKIIAVWEEVLQVSPIGIRDNFFELGGHSLKGIELLGKVGRELAVEIPLSELFAHPTVAELAGYVESTRRTVRSEEWAIATCAKRDYYSASSAQKRMFVLHQLDPAALGYNIPVAFRIEGQVDKARLRRALESLIRRHEVLRTSFMLMDGQPVQVVHDQFTVKIAEWQCEEDQVERVWSDFICPFELGRLPLFRVGLVYLPAGVILLIDLHHIVADGLSVELLMKELVSLYDGLELSKLPIQYKDFAVWQNALLAGNALASLEQYWLQLFSGELPMLKMPTDFPRPAVFGTEGESYSFALSSELAAQIYQLAKRAGVTSYALLLAIYYVFLSKYSGQNDIIIGTPVAGRNHPDLAGLIGMFVNTLALRNQLATGQKFEEFLHIVWENLLTGLDHQDYQFELLVDKLGLMKDLSRNPLFDTMFALQSLGSGAIQAKDFTLTPLQLANRVAKFDLALTALEMDATIQFNFTYSTRLFKGSTIERMSRHLVQLIQSVIEHPQWKIEDLTMVSEEEQRLLLTGFNQTASAYPAGRTLVQIFESQVATRPEQVGLTAGQQQWTYAEINRRANQMGRYLRKMGVGPDQVVGMVLARSPELIITILGILKAGGAYLPLDPAYPAERVKYLLGDSGARLVITGTREEGAKLAGEQEVVALAEETLFSGEDGDLALNHSPANLAYIIYTSGSTGQPKGVMIEHRSVVNILTYLSQLYPLQESGTYLFKTRYTFDVSVAEIFGWFFGEGRLAILEEGLEKDPDAILKACDEYQVTHLNFVPAMLKLFLQRVEEAGKELVRTLRYIFVAGEAISRELVQHFNRLDLPLQLENLYGPTEATIYATRYPLSALTDELTVPIGKPVANLDIYILNPAEQLQPVGVIGEIFIAGDGLARGYLNRPALTAERFVRNPFKPGKLMYKTGDLGRWLMTGDIEFHGRVDHQVKIRGYRIELGEIENTLLQHAKIEDVVVLDQLDSLDTRILVAYYVAKEELDVQELHNFLTTYIPQYMVPAFFVKLEKLPLNPNGKVDRKALPPITAAQPQANRSAYVPPQNGWEERLLAIWQRVLNVEQIGVLDDFFILGGHSLRAIQLLGEINAKLEVQVPLQYFFKHPTIREIANYLEQAEKSSLPPIERVAPRGYYPVSSTQQRLYLLNHYPGAGITYNMPKVFRVQGDLDLMRVKAALAKLVQRHEILRSAFMVVDGTVVQVIAPQLEVEIEYRESMVDDLALLIKEQIRPFDLGQAPLWRVSVCKLAEARYLLTFDINHIISDGISLNIMIREFLEAYAGQELPDLPVQFKDYVAWHNARLSTAELARAEEYWLSEFAYPVPILNLPVDYPGGTTPDFSGNQMTVYLESELTERIGHLVTETRSTLFMVMLAAYGLLLFKYTGQPELVIGTPVGGRHHPDVKNLLGVFINTLGIKLELTGVMTVSQLLTAAREKALQVFEHQEYPFERLLEKLSLPRQQGGNPLFNTMLVVEKMELPALTVDGITLEPVDFQADIAKFDLTVYAAEYNGRLALTFEYASNLFTVETIKRLSGHLREVLRALTSKPACPLAEVEILTAAERDYLIYHCNAARGDFPLEKNLAALFEEQVARAPHSIALEDGEVELTYRELNHRANQLARVLRERGVEPGSIVGLYLEHSPEMVSGILAVLKLGAAYLPIDPEYPVERIRYMLQDSATRLVLTTASSRDKLDFDGPVLDLACQELYQGDGSNLALTYSAETLAYIIYTSGSTGKPKGCMLPHRGVINYIKWAEKHYFRNGQLDLPLYSSIAFDLTVTSLYLPLLTGRKIIIYRKEGDELLIQRIIQENKAGMIKLTPAHLELIKYLPINQTSYRIFVVGGDILRTELVRAIYEKFVGQVEIYNEYGPTETSVGCAIYQYDFERDTSASVPIGKAIDNMQMYVLDQYLKPVPIGVTGEIYIAGAGVGKGYLNRPDLTQERFLPNPFIPGSSMYKTGDLARVLANGDIEFIGRADHQVKIRGYRIELGEIEAQLLQHPAITEVIVITREDHTGSPLLGAYYVAAREIDSNELRAYLAATLPGYMIPEYFLRLDHMPLTGNGKIDRQRLPLPAVIETGTGYMPPANAVEQQLLDIWKALFGLHQIGVQDDFFQLGGHSLKATRLLEMIHQAFEVKLSLAEIFQNASIQKMAELIRQTEKNQFLAIEPAPEQEYYPLSSAQRRMFLLSQLDGVGTCYNTPDLLYVEGELERERLNEAFQQLVHRHESLRTSFEIYNGEVVQKVHEQVALTIEYQEVREVDVAQLLENFVREFDLFCPPLFRVRVVKTGESRYILMFDIHHIISDGVSMQVLIEDLLQFYSGVDLPDLPIHYRDYAVWQNRNAHSSWLAAQKEYWLQRFQGEIPVLNLPTDWPRPVRRNFAGEVIQMVIDADLTRALKELAQKTQTTLFMVLLAIYNVLLYKYTNQQDLVVGSAIAGRRHADLERIIGVFINTLPLRNFPAGTKTFLEFLAEVRENTLQAYDNQDYPLDLLVADLGLQRNNARGPLFDTLFSVNNMEPAALEMAGAKFTPGRVYTKAAHADLVIALVEEAQQISGDVRYSTQLFKAQSIERFIEHLLNTIRQITADPEILIGAVQILSVEEQQKFDATESETQKPVFDADFDF